MIKLVKLISVKFSNAFRGLWVMLKEEKTLWFQIPISILIIIFGMVLKISFADWALITIAITLVIGFEIINTAIEYLVDIVSFEYNVKAKKIKDVSATASLIAILGGLTVVIMVFVPHLIALG